MPTIARRPINHPCAFSADLNGANIERDVTDWWKSSYRLSKSLESEYPAAAQCATQLREDTTAFREHLPVIQVLETPLIQGC